MNNTSKISANRVRITFDINDAPVGISLLDEDCRRINILNPMEEVVDFSMAFQKKRSALHY